MASAAQSSKSPLKSWIADDLKPDMLAGQTVAVVGFGNQGHAHAHNLRESGVSVIVGARAGGVGWQAAKDAGFEVFEIAETASKADLLMLSTPDETHMSIYRDHLHDHMKPGSALLFAHGLAVHYKLIQPRDDIDLILVAPKGPGHLLKRMYTDGMGLPCLIAVAQDYSGQALNRALGYAQGLGGARAGILETSFREECQTDMFGEQAVLCGGVSNLILRGFETLVEAGFPEELAYFECLHEVKLTVDLLHERGLAGMREAISNTAEYGDYVSGRRVIGAPSRAVMKDILEEIMNGQFVEDFIADVSDDYYEMNVQREKARKHPIEAVGKRLRAMMPWLQK